MYFTVIISDCYKGTTMSHIKTRSKRQIQGMNAYSTHAPGYCSIDI